MTSYPRSEGSFIRRLVVEEHDVYRAIFIVMPSALDEAPILIELDAMVTTVKTHAPAWGAKLLADSDRFADGERDETVARTPTLKLFVSAEERYMERADGRLLFAVKFDLNAGARS